MLRRSAADGEGRRPARRRRVLVAGLSLAALALGLVWLERVPLATHTIDRELARRGVVARYRITDLGFGRQRLTDVVIGDPARPDLVADWIETRLDYGLSGPWLAGARVGRVRLRGRIVEGRVSLGALDRLLPPPSGKPFALPALDLAVQDGALALATPAGPVVLAFAGSGKLDGGFRGRVAATAPRLAAAGCTLRDVHADVALAIDDARPGIAGPLRAASIRCAAAASGAAAGALRATFGAALDRWQGRARFALAAPAVPAVRARRLAGTIDFTGDVHATQGALDLRGDGIALAAGTARTARLVGAYTVGSGSHFAGRATAAGASWHGAAGLAARADAAAGTPLAPLVRSAARAAAAALRDVALDADLAWEQGTLMVTRAAAVARSGAHANYVGVEPLLTPAGVDLSGDLAVGGGGLPAARLALRQDRPGAPVSGSAWIAPYAAGSARLALAPVRFTAAAGGSTRIDTVATLSGPLDGGRVERLVVPLAARWDGRRALVLNPACTALTADRIVLGGLDLLRSRVALCPLGDALVRVDDGTVTGGARFAAVRLAGALGGSPLRLAASGGSARLDGTFGLANVAARLGPPDRQSRLDVVSVRGGRGVAGLAGSFADASGRIGAVPLALSDAAGTWRFAHAGLDLAGTLRVADVAPTARFEPLVARDVALTLAAGRVTATGMLHEPTTGTRVAGVTIAHDLAAGRGHADLVVANLAFGDGFQPELLTRATFGVIADVKGAVSGTGRIDWSPAGVTSTGIFRTAGIDLAAAFGPVAGIAGEIRFTDLLALESAPDQVATVASINPGVPVTDGRIVYRTLANSRVQVVGARWPFAGGTLTLDPTLLDFSAPRERRMTFRVDGMDAARFLQQFDFDNLDATGTFDGVLPMRFDESGGRIADGRLAVRPGGGTLAYVGDLTEKDLGFWGNLAFQALKSLRYRDLSVVMNGPLAGEMVTEVRFAGVSQGQGAKSNFLIRRLQRLPFVFNVTIRAPFRGLIDSAASFYDPRRLIQRNLPALIEEQRRREAIQPLASATVPPAKQD